MKVRIGQFDETNYSRILPFIRGRGYSERGLAERFKISRGIRREALSALEAMRVILRKRPSGICLRDVSTEASVDMRVQASGLGMPAQRCCRQTQHRAAAYGFPARHPGKASIHGASACWQQPRRSLTR